MQNPPWLLGTTSSTTLSYSPPSSIIASLHPCASIHRSRRLPSSDGCSPFFMASTATRSSHSSGNAFSLITVCRSRQYAFCTVSGAFFSRYALHPSSPTAVPASILLSAHLHLFHVHTSSTQFPPLILGACLSLSPPSHVVSSSSASVGSFRQACILAPIFAASARTFSGPLSSTPFPLSSSSNIVASWSSLCPCCPCPIASLRILKSSYTTGPFFFDTTSFILSVTLLPSAPCTVLSAASALSLPSSHACMAIRVRSFLSVTSPSPLAQSCNFAHLASTPHARRHVFSPILPSHRLAALVALSHRAACTLFRSFFSFACPIPRALHSTKTQHAPFLAFGSTSRTVLPSPPCRRVWWCLTIPVASFSCHPPPLALHLSVTFTVVAASHGPVSPPMTPRSSSAPVTHSPVSSSPSPSRATSANPSLCIHSLSPFCCSALVLTFMCTSPSSGLAFSSSRTALVATPFPLAVLAVSICVILATQAVPPSSRDQPFSTSARTIPSTLLTVLSPFPVLPLSPSPPLTPPSPLPAPSSSPPSSRPGWPSPAPPVAATLPSITFSTPPAAPTPSVPPVASTASPASVVCHSGAPLPASPLLPVVPFCVLTPMSPPFSLRAPVVLSYRSPPPPPSPVGRVVPILSSSASMSAAHALSSFLSSSSIASSIALSSSSSSPLVAQSSPSSPPSLPSSLQTLLTLSSSPPPALVSAPSSGLPAPSAPFCPFSFSAPPPPRLAPLRTVLASSITLCTAAFIAACLAQVRPFASSPSPASPLASIFAIAAPTACSTSSSTLV